MEVTEAAAAEAMEVAEVGVAEPIAVGVTVVGATVVGAIVVAPVVAFAETEEVVEVAVAVVPRKRSVFSGKRPYTPLILYLPPYQMHGQASNNQPTVTQTLPWPRQRRRLRILKTSTCKTVLALGPWEAFPLPRNFLSALVTARRASVLLSTPIISSL